MYQDHQVLPRRFYKEHCKEGDRCRGRQKKRWVNNIAEWTWLKFCHTVREAEDKIKWRERVAIWRPNGRWLRDRCRCMSIECELHVSTPYKFLHPYTEEKAVTIHTLKNIYFSFTQRRTSSWHAYTKEEAVNMVHKRPSGYHADTVNNQLPSSHREKSSCYTHTHKHLPTHPERRTNREEQANNIHTEKTISYYICRHIRISSLEITKEQAVTSHT